MHIYLDESGDLGFETAKQGTSRYFVITMLISKETHALSSSIHRTLKSKLRQKKKTRHIFELKGSSTNLSIKRYFYQQLTKYKDWYLSSIVSDKTLADSSIKQNKADFYNKVACNLVNTLHIPPNETTLHLIIDRSKTSKEIQKFDKAMNEQLQSKLPTGCQLTISHLNSRDSAGLQAVDLFCYGIARFYEHSDTSWYRIFQHKIVKQMEFSGKRKDGP